MDASSPDYHILVDHYENCLDQYGTNHLGVDWPNLNDLLTRFNVMLEVCEIKETPVSLLDLGCGYGALLEYIQNSSYSPCLQYFGLDLSAKMIAAAQQQFNLSCFEQRDILINPLPADSFDYVVMNGVFTEKRDLSQQQMENFFAKMLHQAFTTCRKAIAFNVMSNHVDWFREDLFHVSFDRMAEIVMKQCSRHFTIRADYGLYEYTVYVYKAARVSTP